jgi:hypothetical protein
MIYALISNVLDHSSAAPRLFEDGLVNSAMDSGSGSKQKDQKIWLPSPEVGLGLEFFFGLEASPDPTRPLHIANQTVVAKLTETNFFSPPTISKRRRNFDAAN